MSRFDELAAFAAVVREGSFTRAAAQIGVSQSALSHTIRGLEQRLRVKLLNRTTRSVAPTEAGERLYQTVAPSLSDIDAALDSLGELRDHPAGTVRITATQHAAHTLVWPRLEPVLTRYPDIQVEINADDRFVDIVAERYDIGVRLSADVAKDMIAARMTPDVRLAVVASPNYLAQHGRPAKPQDLTGHLCIGRRLPTHGGLMAWDFMRRGRALSVHVTGRLVFNSGTLILEAALRGHGLAFLPLEAVQPHLAAGNLEQVLEDWAAVYPGYHLYYAGRRSSAVLSLVVEALKRSGE